MEPRILQSLSPKLMLAMTWSIAQISGPEERCKWGCYVFGINVVLEWCHYGHTNTNYSNRKDRHLLRCLTPLWTELPLSPSTFTASVCGWLSLFALARAGTNHAVYLYNMYTCFAFTKPSNPDLRNLGPLLRSQSNIHDI